VAPLELTPFKVAENHYRGIPGTRWVPLRKFQGLVLLVQSFTEHSYPSPARPGTGSCNSSMLPWLDLL
jgi:hypothetical protein